MIFNLINLNFKDWWINIYDYILFCIHSNLSYSSIHNFFLENKYTLLFLLLIYACILLDSTFSWRRKILILPYFLFLLFFLLCFRGSFLISELFWYTLLLNGSFIFHVCICDWFYRLFKYLRWYYGAFLVTRISFFFSLSFLVYLSNLLNIELYYTIFEKSLYKNKKWFQLVFHNLDIIIHTLRLVLLFFISLFTNYALFLKGINLYSFTVKNLAKFLLIFTSTLIISWFILGIPRLYFIWFILGASYLNKWLNYCNYNILQTYYNMVDYLRLDTINFLDNLDNNFNRIYASGYNYGFLYFMDLYDNFTNPYTPEYHLKCPFFYYNREKLLLTFFRSHFKRIIQEEKSISNEKYNCVIKLATVELNIKDDELEFWHKKLKKIYKKTLNIWNGL